jgi:hypothetical protein
LDFLQSDTANYLERKTRYQILMGQICLDCSGANCKLVPDVLEYPLNICVL